MNTIGREALTALLRFRVKRTLRKLGLDPKLGEARGEPRPIHMWDTVLYRRNNRFDIAVPEDPAAQTYVGRESLAGFLYLFHHCAPDVARMSVSCSDGHEATAARFAQCSRSDDIILLPDHYFVTRRGFAAERALAEANPVPWHQRRDHLIWRGGANGEGIHPLTAEDAPNPRVIQRARLCLLLAGHPHADALLTAGQNEKRPLAAFSPLGITGAPRPEAEWLGDKYAIDIDGWTNAWSNLLIRMHFGCCVLKVASADGYRQWWYDRLVPWEHFVPVRADMSDLLEKIDWVRTNDAEASAIAARGQALARSMTLESETAHAVRLIEANWQDR